ncbi:MAG: WD40/YVTN/BNR-like repeat-containing protein [Pseudomonadota bacterium]
MSTKRSRRGARPRPGFDRRTSAARGRRRGPSLIIIAGGLVAIALAAVLVVRPWADEGDAVSWSTLGTADVHSPAFDPGNGSRLYFGHHGGLLESRDGGRSWQAATLSGADAMNVRIGEDRAQIAGHDVYLESIDGGVTWQPVPNDLPGLDLHAFAIDPGDADHAWAFAAGFGLFETTDAGRHFSLRQPGNWGYLAAYRQGDDTVLLAVGQDGLVRSSDGGASWGEALAYPGAALAGGLAAATDGSVLYVATTAGLRRSTDGGASWQPTAFSGVVLAIALAPGDPRAVAIVDEATRFYRSPDGGATWPGPSG